MEQLGKLRGEEDEEGEPAIERRREYTDLELDLGEREEQVVCHASVLALARNGRFGRIQCQRGKESSSRGKRKRRVFLCSRTVRVKVGGKAIPASFLKIEEREGRSLG